MINLNSLTKNIKDGFKAPTGDSNRETPTKGALRFNTETGKPEIYAKGRGWRRASVSEISAIYTHDNLVAFYDASNADTTGDTSDQYYSDVELLLHMNGTDGSTTFTDSGPNNYNPTSTGGAQISNSQSKFGGSSGNFANSRLRYAGSVGNLDGSSNSWTIEMWVYPTKSDTNVRYLLNKDGEYNVIVNAYGLYYTKNGIAFNYRNSAGNYKDVNSGGTPFNYNEWNHLAVVRDGSTSITIFLNGVQVGQKTTDLTMGYDSNRYLDIGTGNFNTTDHFVGYLDEVRITKGVARYTADFTPQTREFYPGDSVSDLTSNDIDSVYVGNVTLNSTEPKSFNWPTWQAYGDVNYLESVSNASALPVLNDNLTIVAWVKYDDGAFSSNRYHAIMYLFVDESNVIKINKVRSGYSAAPNRLYGQLGSGGSYYTIGVDGSLPALSSSTGWFQVALTLSNDELKLYFNANQLGSTLTVPSSRSTSQPSFVVGRNFNTDETLEADMFGDIAIVKVYNSALSSADITSEFNYHKSTFGL